VDRIAQLDGEISSYWPRNPISFSVRNVNLIYRHGDFFFTNGDDSAYNSWSGVRPALNVKSDILVSEIEDY